MSKNFMTKLSRLGGEVPKSISSPKVPPIYLNSVFQFDDVDSLDEVYNKESSGYVYSRMANPNNDILAQILAGIEEGEDARVYSSGMAAISMSIMTNVKSGDHIVADRVLYGGTFKFFAEELKKYNIEVSFVDFENDDLDSFFKPETKIVYIETISNPLMQVVDIKKIADAAHKHGAMLIVDNTFATPIVCQPLSLGADIIVYSATKYICGHSDIIGGAVVSTKENIERIHGTAALYGTTMSPFDSWMLARSLRTLEMRVRQHSVNAQELAEFLCTHENISNVFYPGLTGSKSKVIADKIFCNQLYGGMLSIELKGGKAAAYKLIEKLEHIKFLPSLASYTTSISYPSKTSHRDLPIKERERAGISDGLLRISVGLENIDDLKLEFKRALDTL